jgi:spermidine synthase
MSNTKLRTTRITVTAFAGGILTLGLEIVSGRLLAPFFGSSLHQWAALIGVVLLAYVLGYETYSRINSWGPAVPFAIGGLYTLALPLWLTSLVNPLLNLPLMGSAIGSALLATGLPSILWASVLPFLQKQKETKSSSRVLAWSTAGNLAGVWGVAFVGVPEFGTKATLLSLGGLSLLLSALWMTEFRKKHLFALGLPLLLILGFLLRIELNASEINWGKRLLNRDDTQTHWVKIKDTEYQQVVLWDGSVGNEKRRLLMLNGNVQFIWKPEEKLTLGNRYEYYNYVTAAAYWTGHGPARSILAFGVAGGLIPWQIRQFLPQIEVTGFELDSTLAHLSQENLPLKSVQPIDLQIGDGRFLLSQTQKKFDLIVLDSFFSGYVPFHLTTQEFFELVKAHLNPGGIVVANFHTIFALTGLLSHLEKTMSSVFQSVTFLDLPSGVTLAVASPESTSFNERFLHAAEESPPELVPYSLRASEFLQKSKGSRSPSQIILTDDLNRTEQLLYGTRQFIIVPELF